MSISKFDRRTSDSISDQVRRIKKMKDAEIARRRIGWVIFILALIALVVWLWQYLGPGTGE